MDNDRLGRLTRLVTHLIDHVDPQGAHACQGDTAEAIRFLQADGLTAEQAVAFLSDLRARCCCDCVFQSLDYDLPSIPGLVEWTCRVTNGAMHTTAAVTR